MRRYPHKLQTNLKYLDRNTIRKTAVCSIENTVNFVEKLCQHLMVRPDPDIVPIYSFKRLGTNHKTYKYQYDMQAMLMLTTEERQAIMACVDLWEENECYPSNWQSSKYKFDEMMLGWAQYPELMRFMDRLYKENRYHDIHDGNIMIDEQDNYRIIDLEGYIYHDLNDPMNDWFNK